MGHWEINPKREMHSITGVSQKQNITKQNKKQEKAHINDQTSHLRELEKEQQTS